MFASYARATLVLCYSFLMTQAACTATSSQQDRDVGTPGQVQNDGSTTEPLADGGGGEADAQGPPGDKCFDLSRECPEVGSTGCPRSSCVHQEDANDKEVCIPAGHFIFTGAQCEEMANCVYHGYCAYLPEFIVDKYEVSESDYYECVKAGVCTLSGMTPQYLPYSAYTLCIPREDSSYPQLANWEQANAYCAWKGKRLPTWFEWQKAARGPFGNTYPWGNEYNAEDLCSYGNAAVSCSDNQYCALSEICEDDPSCTTQKLEDECRVDCIPCGDLGTYVYEECTKPWRTCNCDELANDYALFWQCCHECGGVLPHALYASPFLQCCEGQGCEQAASVAEFLNCCFDAGCACQRGPDQCNPQESEYRVGCCQYTRECVPAIPDSVDVARGDISYYGVVNMASNIVEAVDDWYLDLVDLNDRFGQEVLLDYNTRRLDQLADTCELSDEQAARPYPGKRWAAAGGSWLTNYSSGDFTSPLAMIFASGGWEISLQEAWSRSGLEAGFRCARRVENDIPSDVNQWLYDKIAAGEDVREDYARICEEQ